MVTNFTNHEIRVPEFIRSSNLTKIKLQPQIRRSRDTELDQSPTKLKS